VSVPVDFRGVLVSAVTNISYELFGLVHGLRLNFKFGDFFFNRSWSRNHFFFLNDLLFLCLRCGLYLFRLL